jgi:hypothetical protein
MILSLILAALISSGKLPPAQPIARPDFDPANVLAPIRQLFSAFAAGDGQAVLRLVYPDGRVTATGVRSTSSGLRQQSWSEFAQGLKPDAPFTETISDPAIEVDGDIAMVWAPFVVRIGGKVANCGVDHFDMVKDNGAWKVMNLTFSSRTSGCPTE